MAWDSIGALLLWIATGGGAMVLAGAVVSFLLANWPWFNKWPTWAKAIAPIVLAGVFGVGAQVLITLDVSSLIPLPVAGLILVFINYLASQAVYMRIKPSGYASRARNGV